MNYSSCNFNRKLRRKLRRKCRKRRTKQGHKAGEGRETNRCYGINDWTRKRHRKRRRKTPSENAVGKRRRKTPETASGGQRSETASETSETYSKAGAVTSEQRRWETTEMTGRNFDQSPVMST